MARDLDLDELLDSFTLTADELKLLRNKSGATRLGFAVTLRFLLWRGRFPRGRGEVPDNAIAHVAKQAKVEPSEIAFYDWQGRSAKRNRTEIRDFTGFGECSVADAEKVTLWLAENVCDQERNPDRVRQRLLEHCKEELIEPPEKTRIERIVRSALSQAEDAMMARAVEEVPAEVVERMLTLIGQASDDPDEAPADGEGPEVYAQIKDAPGNVSLKTLIAEKTKLEAVRAVGVPHRAFARLPAKMVAAWRDRAAAEAPSHLRGHPRLEVFALFGDRARTSARVSPRSMASGSTAFRRRASLACYCSKRWRSILARWASSTACPRTVRALVEISSNRSLVVCGSAASSPL